MKCFWALEESKLENIHVPLTLYDISIKVLANKIGNEQIIRNEYRKLPDYVLFDLYYQLYCDNELYSLINELIDLQLFARLLRIPYKRVKLLKLFQKLQDNSSIKFTIVKSYQRQVESNLITHNLIDTGLLLGGFLKDSGWYADSATVLKYVEQLCLEHPKMEFVQQKLLNCYHMLLHVQSLYSNFDGALETFGRILKQLENLDTEQCCESMLGGLYTEFSVFHFVRSEYDDANRWSLKALQHLKHYHQANKLPAGLIVDILRQASKTYVVKRKFKKADLLIRQAVDIACNFYKKIHPKVSDVLMDYAFYLLNSDSIVQSVKVYEVALDIRKKLFCRRNLKVAVAHEDLAYALYVNEYSTGKFYKAREHSDEAISILDSLVPSDHFMLSSAKRVKALILEEVALDIPGNLNSSEYREKLDYLRKSEELHLSALKLSLKAFGERNVQTAKHYGNLGRLYQSMSEYEKAEKMHLTAISIKEDILGSEDYEVGLSVGHLASLYNYHMGKFREAEKLYLRSILISLKLFGESYSGLEYDYRGLLHVYSELNEVYRVVEYTNTLSNWFTIRDRIVQDEDSLDEINSPPKPLEHVLDVFFNMS